MAVYWDAIWEGDHAAAAAIAPATGVAASYAIGLRGGVGHPTAATRRSSTAQALYDGCFE